MDKTPAVIEQSESPSLRDLGIRSWRGAAIFSLELWVALVFILAVLKLAGTSFLVDYAWWIIFVRPAGTALVMFVILALHASIMNPKAWR